jgi:Uma2 family endonuclease
MQELVVPDTEPESEWVRGRVLQKVSPQRRHAIVQLAIGSQLAEWARGRGEVGTEWRFRVAPPGEIRRPLVPDIAYLSFERMRGLDEPDREIPPLAPDIVVEIISPDDLAADVDHKRAVYLRAGTQLVIIVDPKTRRATVSAADGSLTAYGAGDTIEPRGFPGLRLVLPDAFARLDGQR